MEDRLITTGALFFSKKLDCFEIPPDEKGESLYRYLHESASIDELVRRTAGVLRGMGISDFAHSPINNNCGILDPCGTYGTKYLDQYAKEEFHHGDLVVRHLLTSKTPIFRSVISEHIDAAPYDNEIFHLYRDASRFIKKCGLLDVYSVPIFSADSAFTFAVSTHNLDPSIFQERVTRNRTEIHRLATFFDEIGRNRFSSHFHKSNPRVPISGRAIELLELITKKDCSLAEAAELMGIEISTANKHMKRAKMALGSETIQGAVVAAIKQKLILLD